MENCWEEAPHGSQDYYPHYNLFQSSIFYDTDNFRVSYLSYDDCLPSKSSVNEARSAEPPDKPEPPEPPEAEALPVPARRLITKEELYRNPDLFKSKFEDGPTCSQITSNGFMDTNQAWGYDWTRQSWVKEGASLDTQEAPPGRPEPEGPRVSSSKAESMMQKMGWQGGALGKSGVGITQPITPDSVYAFGSNLGFGQRTKPPTKPPPKPPAKTPNKKHSPKRDAFRTNVLLQILEFVQDDTETELLFDSSLRQYERRHISNIVHTVVNEQQVHALGSAAQYDLAADIHRRNGYVLETVRQGEGDKRQLGIYKEPPEDVYLVTPDDFLPKDDITESDKSEYDKNTNEEKIENGMELDEDENPFLKSIKKSIKKDEEPAITNKLTDCSIEDSEPKDLVVKVDTPVPATEKMIEFFLEFAETESFSELRFLGKFTDPQLCAINSLLNHVAMWSLRDGYGDETEVERACRAAGCRLREGANGTTQIHKVPANSRKA